MVSAAAKRLFLGLGSNRLNLSRGTRSRILGNLRFIAPPRQSPSLLELFGSQQRNLSNWSFVLLTKVMYTIMHT
jgi:hypothetical protein